MLNNTVNPPAARLLVALVMLTQAFLVASVERATTKSTTPTISYPASQAPINSSIDGKDVEHLKKILAKQAGESRLILNKPTLAPQMHDFAPNSIEARVSDATTQFGLNFIKKVSLGDTKNVIFSPLSLQNLMNMVLLGTTINSATEHQLADVLGYIATGLLSDNLTDINSDQRLKPHEAMRNVFQSIRSATHLTISPSPVGASNEGPDLFNTDPESVEQDELKLPISSGKKGNKFSALLQTSSKENSTALSGQLNFTLANLVLTNTDSVSLKPDYEKDLKTYYNVNIEHFTRSKDEEPLHDRVNNWVRNQTNNQIGVLAEKVDLEDPSLIMVLLNAAHFKGRWLHTFNTRSTHEALFYNDGLESGGSKIMFMRQKGVFGYAEFGSASNQAEMDAFLAQMAPPGYTRTTPAPPTLELSKEEMRKIELTSKLNCKAIMLPFSLNDGHELSMVILLPAKIDGIEELQAALDGPTLNEIYRSLIEQQVQLELPKFSFEASIDAGRTLRDMGVDSIFTEGANLGGMFTTNSAQNKAKVDKIIHKAKINVDESGAEAAAVSMVSIALRTFVRPPPTSFEANHPFLFVIRHNRSNMPLFMGRVNRL